MTARSDVRRRARRRATTAIRKPDTGAHAGDVDLVPVTTPPSSSPPVIARRTVALDQRLRR
jgi:hypothetical protein